MRVIIFVLGVILLFTFSFVYGKTYEKKNIKQLVIPLTKHKSVYHRLLEMGIKPEVINSIFLKRRKPRPKGDVQNDTVPLFKYLDSEFYGEILLGHPGQKFKVIFDTTWGDSFVPSVRCSYYDVACQKHARYDSGRSSTFVKNGTEIELDYGSEKIKGLLSEDLLHMGHVNVTNQTFMEATNLPKIFLHSEADGIFGMGFQDLSKSSGAPFFYNLMAQFPKMPKLFSFYMNRDVTTERGGSLLLGGISKKHYNTSVGIKYFDVIQPKYWTIHMSSVYFSHPTEPLCAAGCNVIFDTGASVIQVPLLDLKKINERIIANAVLNETGRYEVDCFRVLKLPQINFVFNGTEFHLKGKEYIQNVYYGPQLTCMSAFIASGTNDTWVLGGAFLYRHYAVFDIANKRVGLAQALL